MEQLLNLNNYKYRLLIAGGALVCFAFIAYEVSTNDVLEFDTVIREWAYSIRGPVTKAFFIPCTYVGNWQTLTILAFIMILIKKTRRKIGFPMVITAISSTIIYKIVKMIFLRPRPDISLHLINQGGYSFPSGHSMNGIVYFGILIYLIRKNCENKTMKNILTVLISILIILIGFSRIFVGVHYPTDVLGGWALGITLVMISTIIIDKMEERNVLQFDKRDNR